MSDGQPRQVQCKLGDVDADGNWQLGSPAPASATDDIRTTRPRLSMSRATSDSPLVADAVLGGCATGRSCCRAARTATPRKKPLAYGKADQPAAQAAKRARKAEERTESAAKRPARRRGRGRGRGRSQLPDSSDEDEEVGGARTPPPRAPAPPSGSDEDSDEEDDESDSGSSPSDD